jgi:hypothetical protein
MFDKWKNRGMAASSAFVALVDSSTRFAAPASDELSDASLMGLQRELAEVRRRVDAWSASIAAQIAHRSRPELGHAGLAQRHGARTPQLLVQKLAGTTTREAHTMVRVGRLITTPSALEAVGDAVAEGRLSLDAADVIRAGFDHLHDSVPLDSVADAAESLIQDAGSLTVEKLATRAREFAAVHVVDRERAMREARFLRLVPLTDGMTRLTGLLDPESAAVVVATFDAITSPRRGGPRFVDPAAADYADRISHDERTTDQLAVDSFVELLRLGGAAAPEVVGAQRPAVRVLVTDRDLARRAGFGHLEGQRAPIGIRTVEREVCDRGTVPLHFDSDGQIVNLGRTQRLFTARQRIGLAARDGGCRFLDCDRPPSWCEAHHIDEWAEDGGRTDVADGILMCRHHHLLLHDNGWRVTRDRAEYFLVPPPSVDPFQKAIPVPPKSSMVKRALAAM